MDLQVGDNTAVMIAPSPEDVHGCSPVISQRNMLLQVDDDDNATMKPPAKDFFVPPGGLTLQVRCLYCVHSALCSLNDKSWWYYWVLISISITFQGYATVTWNNWLPQYEDSSAACLNHFSSNWHQSESSNCIVWLSEDGALPEVPEGRPIR